MKSRAYAIDTMNVDQMVVHERLEVGLPQRPVRVLADLTTG